MSDRTDHANLLAADLDHDSYDEWIEWLFFRSRGDPDDFGGDWFQRRRSELAYRGLDDHVLDARSRYENGLFGNLLGVVHNQPGRERWNELKAGDCRRCGEADAGQIGVYRRVEGPDGEIAHLAHDSILCSDCEETLISYWEEHGAVAPNIARWSQ